MMFVAGTLSGLLGIGSGAVKVLAMDRIMKVPFKVSTTTSNFMIGVTAAASAGIYLHRGLITPGLAFPVMLGVLSGSLIGARYLVRAHVAVLRSRIYDRHPGARSRDDHQRGDEMVLRAKPARTSDTKTISTTVRMETIMGRLLQVGVLLASFVMLMGGIFICRAHHEAAPGLPDIQERTASVAAYRRGDERSS